MANTILAVISIAALITSFSALVAWAIALKFMVDILDMQRTLRERADLSDYRLDAHDRYTQQQRS